ncbi:MAG: ChbG/HpnK family deacetylase [Acidobacteriia bacterium]|nr:ChbG/HpnK family deacetylase [Terriglobia bacterium]
MVVNADDFGFTPDVNEGIVEAHRKGILTATTLMANGEAFEHAMALARANPTLDIGCHLVLVGGRSLVNGNPLPPTAPGLIAAVAQRRIPVHEELRAQVRRVVQAGIAPTHLDTHKHTHLAPPVLEAVARVAEEFGIQWVRRPFDFPLTAGHAGVPFVTRLTSGAMGLVRSRFQRALEKRQLRSTDHFAGFQITGRFRKSELVALIGELPQGSTELMCHPGFCGAALRAAPTRLKESREEELRALTAPEVREAVARAGIDLVNYRKLR